MTLGQFITSQTFHSLWNMVSSDSLIGFVLWGLNVIKSEPLRIVPTMPSVASQVHTLPVCSIEMISSACCHWTMPMSPSLQPPGRSLGPTVSPGFWLRRAGESAQGQMASSRLALLLALPRRPHRLWGSSSTIPGIGSCPFCPELSKPLDIPLLLAQTCFSTEEDWS